MVGLLDQFFGCYFHQDWPDDDTSWHAVVARYRAENAEGEPIRVADEIAKLIQQYPDDVALAAKLDQLGCYFWPGNPSLFGGWLSEVEHELR